MTNGSRKSKRKANPEPPLNINKKLRSKLPRRRRCQISPVLIVSSKIKSSGENARFSFISVDSSSSCDFAGVDGEASCVSSRASAVLARDGSYNKLKKRLPGEIEVSHNVERVGDLKRNQRFEKRSVNEVELSESSCVDSNSGVHEQRRSLILKLNSGNVIKNLQENDEVSEACTKSEISNDEIFSSKNSNSGNANLNLKVSSEINKNDVISVSVSSTFPATSFEDEKTRCKKNRASEFECSPGSKNDVVSNLACTEKLEFSYYDDESEYGSTQETSSFCDLHSEIFVGSSELELSDYSPSLFIDSGSQFTQGSGEETETPSPTYSLFLQYCKEFSTLTSQISNSSSVEDEVTLKYKYERFEDLDEEENYQMLRKRERKQVFMSNYAETYISTTEVGELVLQQRSQMVRWITEVCSKTS
ncbi:hypothetical protein Lalb_Chr10g0095591 [Lupinus albus]|uniref:Uncharacterized protein n=1 Tax=Lupinus albus TaxID=3870 RepID=A0A6A4PUE8_LUPAL|nr:hypothetical protein Lalb_Chr10g0095591 [Lupinus albus]